MISAAYCQTMAQYNLWQNKQLSDCLDVLPEAALTEDGGAFFGSILATLSHLSWGDWIWMSRFEGRDAPPGGIAESTSLFADLAGWRDLRAGLDQRIIDWAASVTDEAVAGELKWHSGALNRDMTQPMALCVTHFFNHQTHHRGQVHALITRAGGKAPVSDLAFLPEDI